MSEILHSFANDNGKSVRAAIEANLRGVDPRLTLYPVFEHEVRREAFRRDACNVVANILSGVPYRQAFDVFLDAWVHWRGCFITEFGKEYRFDDALIDQISDEWFRDHFSNRLPTDPAVRLRRDNLHPLIFIFSLAKIICPVDMALCGRSIANDP